jgi:hypothetical protein
MADPLTILLFVATGEGADATTRAMARATREALGPGASVEVRETPTGLTEDAALIAEQLGHVDAVVDLTWTDPNHRNATLRVHVARTGRWVGRSIGFMPSDASTERGRTIGFAVVSMLPEPVDPPQLPAPADSAAPPSPLPAESPRAHLAAAPSSPSIDQAPPPAATSFIPSFALDLFAVGAWGVAGDGVNGGGGGVAGAWFPLPSMSLRLSGGVRAGSSGLVQTSTLSVPMTIGVGWHPVRTTMSHPFGISLRADYVLFYESLQYSRLGGGGMMDRWLSGVAATVDALWLFSLDVEAFAGPGLEYAFGTTIVDAQVPRPAQTTLPPLRAVAELGVRVRF